MAVHDLLPIVMPSFSSISSPLTEPRRQKRPVPIATDNSSTFIQFPSNIRRSSAFVPLFQPQINVSSKRDFCYIADTQSISNKSKSSSKTRTQQNHDQIEPKINPILNNPLLNHRRMQTKMNPVKISTNCFSTTNFSKPIANDNQIIITQTSIISLTDCKNDKSINVSNNESEKREQLEYIDGTKYDYIKRWLDEIRSRTHCKKLCVKCKRSQKRYLKP